MAYQQQQGMPGTKSYTDVNAATSVASPAINPAKAGGKAPEDFGWSAMDYKFGDRPLYQVAKAAMKGNWCGKTAPTNKGMVGPSQNAAAQAAAAQSAAAQNAAAMAAMDTSGAAASSAAAAAEPWNEIGGS